MSAELQQNAGVVLDLSVKGASGLTAGAGVLTAFSIIAPIAGTIASVVGVFVTLHLWRRKNRIFDLQEAEIERQRKKDGAIQQ